MMLPHMKLMNEHNSSYKIGALIGDPEGFTHKVEIIDRQTSRCWHKAKGMSAEDAAKRCFETINFSAAPRNASEVVKDQALEIERLKAMLEAAQSKKGGRTIKSSNPAEPAPELPGDDEG